jgi:AcrR family transcriptional regulator
MFVALQNWVERGTVRGHDTSNVEKHFPSKANLVATYLRHKSAVWFQMLETATERPGLSPLERILAIFDALNGSFRSPAFRGCPFVKGLAEFGPEANAPDVQATSRACTNL